MLPKKNIRMSRLGKILFLIMPMNGCLRKMCTGQECITPSLSFQPFAAKRLPGIISVYSVFFSEFLLC